MSVKLVPVSAGATSRSIEPNQLSIDDLIDSHLDMNQVRIIEDILKVFFDVLLSFILVSLRSQDGRAV